MRIAWTSDLHVDVCQRNADLLPHLSRRVAELDADVLVIAGDVAEHVKDVQQALQAFAGLRATRLYIPGNHDLFTEEASDGSLLNSQQKLEKQLPEAAENSGFGYLGLRPYPVGTYTFVGTCGWFDASLQDTGLAPFLADHHYQSGVWRGLRSYDHGHVLWPATTVNYAMPCSGTAFWATDPALCDHMLRSLQQQLREASAESSIIGVVHVLPFPEIVQRASFGPSGFYDAWIGSARLGDCLRRDKRVRLVISGHQHSITDCAITPQLRAVANPVGDARKSPLDLPALAAERVGVLDLP